MGVIVSSWSRNCANCIIMSVYRVCRFDISGWMTVDTTRGDGRGVPVTELMRGRLTPGKTEDLKDKVQCILPAILTPNWDLLAPKWDDSWHPYGTIFSYFVTNMRLFVPPKWGLSWCPNGTLIFFPICDLISVRSNGVLSQI